MRPTKGVGWRKMLGAFPRTMGTVGVAGIAAAAGYMGAEYATRVQKHELIGMSYLGKSEEELYEALTSSGRPKGWLGMSDVIHPWKQEEGESAATVGTAFHEYLEALKMGKDSNVKEIEKHIYSKKYGLSGYADVIYEDDTVSDIKSVGAKVFAQVKSRGAPLQKHFDQVNTYAFLNKSRKGRMEYHLRSDPSQKIVHEWETSEENFKQTIEKVNRVRQRINTEIATGQLNIEDLPTKSSLAFERIGNLFTTNKYSFNVEGVKEALGSFINKREQFHNDQKVSTFNKLQNVNITNMMEGNKTEYMFQAAKNGARRHNNMGYS